MDAKDLKKIVEENMSRESGKPVTISDKEFEKHLLELEEMGYIESVTPVVPLSFLFDAICNAGFAAFNIEEKIKKSVFVNVGTAYLLESGMFIIDNGLEGQDRETWLADAEKTAKEYKVTEA